MTSAVERPRAFSVWLFVPDGNPDAVKTVEKSNWSGAGLVVPRTLFTEARKREEFGRAGVYLLVGPDSESQLPRVYVGEGDPIGPRLDQHAKLKDFWTHAVAFTSKDANLNKAHVQFLESRLVDLARYAKRCVLDNGNTPQAPSLSEADRADSEGFLADVMLCLPILGYGFFEAVAPRPHAALEFRIEAKGIEATGFESPSGFVIRQGSQAVKTEVPSIFPFLTELRRSLVDKGVFADAGTHYVFTQDYAFPSPSTAAGVALGRSENGRTIWKTRDGRTLKSVQDEEIGNAGEGGG